MELILIAVGVLGLIGLASALILFFASHKFAVYEDPRIAQVSAVLPQANCGGCGYPGCSGFASACVKASADGNIEGKFCPVGGQPVMEQVAEILGLAVETQAPRVAVVRCNGSCENRPRLVQFDGARSFFGIHFAPSRTCFSLLYQPPRHKSATKSGRRGKLPLFESGEWTF